MEQETNLNKEPQESIVPEERIAEPVKQKPLGFWATIGFSAIIAGAYLFASVIAAIGFFIFAALRNPKFDPNAYGESLAGNGLFFSVLIVAYSPVVVGLVFLFALIRKKMPVREYLNLRKPNLKQVLLWSTAVILLWLCYDGLMVLLGRPVVPEYMKEAYRTAYFLPLLWFAIVILGPIPEEFFFRGFLLKGLEYSKIGTVWAIILTSFLWAIIHLQYNVYEMSNIFIGGIFLGWARVKTRSIYIPIIMHSIVNLIATVECAIAVSRG